MFPQKTDKQVSSSFITAEKALAFMQKIGRVPSIDPPQRVILTYQDAFTERIPTRYPGKQATGTFRKLFYLDQFPGTAVANFGVGAPATVSKMELLIAWGVREFISIGTAGAISPHLQIGDLVVCDRAIRDEGTSYHYLPKSKYVSPTDEGALHRKFASLPHLVGTTWTLDAFFRHTREEILQYQQEGVLTVEMEASALFAVGQVRGVSVGAAFVVSDLLGGEEWEPKFHSQVVEEGLWKLLEISLTGSELDTSSTKNHEISHARHVSAEPRASGS